MTSRGTAVGNGATTLTRRTAVVDVLAWRLEALRG